MKKKKNSILIHSIDISHADNRLIPIWRYEHRGTLKDYVHVITQETTIDWSGQVYGT